MPKGRRGNKNDAAAVPHGLRGATSGAQYGSVGRKKTNMKPMTLFSIVFAAILAAAAVILTGIYAKARLDDWEKAKWMIIAEMRNNNAASQAISDRYMAEARQWAISGYVANVNLYSDAALKESQESLKRLREIQTRAV